VDLLELVRSGDGAPPRDLVGRQPDRRFDRKRRRYIVAAARPRLVGHAPGSSGGRRHVQMLHPITTVRIVRPVGKGRAERTGRRDSTATPPGLQTDAMVPTSTSA
jgi:hypothetical protein